MGALYPWKTHYLFANLLFFTIGEDDEATSSSFATRYAAIEASSASLEVLVATLLLASSTIK